jgi:hypothetical protein
MIVTVLDWVQTQVLGNGSSDHETEIDTNSRTDRRRLVPFWLSQYLWLGVVGIAFLSGLFIVERRTVDQIPSASRVFNSSADPVYMAVVADPHIDTPSNLHAYRYVQALEFAQNISVDTFVVAGDLVTNWGGKTLVRYGDQFESEFIAFRRLTNHFSFKYFFDLPGNHDEFGLLSYASPRHHYRFYSVTNYSNDEDKFRIFTVETPDFAFIFLNPFYFPTTHAVIDFWAHPRDKMLDDFERAVRQFANHTNLFLFTHFPGQMWLGERSQQFSKRFESILNASNAHLMVTGHLHPRQPKFMHHGNLLEVVAVDTVWHSSLGIITVDNGCAVFHSVNTEHCPTGFVTNPIPLNQITHRSVFNECNLTIRVLVHGEHCRKAVISANGCINLTFDRIVRPRVCLFSAFATFNPGYHTLHFSGVLINSTHFFVGNFTDPQIEISYSFPQIFKIGRVSAVVLWALLALVLFPYQPTRLKFMTATAIAWLAGDSTESQWLMCTVGGALVVRARIQLLPFTIRCILFGACIMPLFVPFIWFEVEGYHGKVDIHGYTISETVSDVWGLLFPLFYQAFVITPATLLASSIAVSCPWNDVLWIDVGLALICYALGALFTNLFLVQLAGCFYANLTCMLMWVPFVIDGVLVGWMIKRPGYEYLFAGHCQNEESCSHAEASESIV